MMHMIGEKIERSNSLRFVIIILLILVLASIVVVGYFLLNGKENKDILKSSASGDEHTLALEEFVVNLKSENSMRRYLKIKMSLMYKDKKHEEVLSTNVSKIRDQIINQLRSKTPEDILDIDKTSELKKEIVDDINSAISGNIVQDIYFTDLVIQ